MSDAVELSTRLLAVLGGCRDALTPDYVTAFQRIADDLAATSPPEAAGVTGAGDLPPEVIHQISAASYYASVDEEMGADWQAGAESAYKKCLAIVGQALARQQHAPREPSADLIEQQAARLEALSAEREGFREALAQLSAFVAIMCGRGPDAIIPETIDSPLGVPIKIGAIMRNARAALSPKEQDNG